MPDWFAWTSNAELGLAVLMAREASGLTQAQLARRAGVDRKLIYRLENGRSAVRADKVIQVLATLGLMPVIVPSEVLGMLR